MAVSDRTWERLVELEVGNHDHRLYGGSQYHRTLREFHLATRCLRLPSITEDEIANAAGIGESHDGVNFLHAACVIALEKARISFDPLLRALQLRMKHVMDRLCPVTEYMLRETRERAKVTNVVGMDNSVDPAMDISQNPQFRQLMRGIFSKFVDRCSDSAMMKCRDDLVSITRYVTWNLDERSSGALTRALPDKTSMVAVYNVALKAKGDEPKGKDADNSGALTESKPLMPLVDNSRNVDRDYQNLIQLMEEAVMSRNANRTNIVVGGLVQHIVASWQDQFCRSVITKFNCYFMMPFVDSFHRFIREELQKIYDGDGTSISDVFDMSAVRKSLLEQREQLAAECMANKRLQEKFRMCSRLMMTPHDAAEPVFDGYAR